jgi:DNA-directed RNA polymerase specialized sigma24 family protein
MMISESEQNIQQPLNQNYTYGDHARDFLSKVESLCSNNIEGDSLYKYISNRIKDLRLNNIDYRDIISEATVRGLDYISKTQKAIQNPKAWIRVTVSNILLEEVRKAHKSLSIADDFDFINLDSPVDIGSLSENPTKALMAFHSLSNSERRIITYKLFQGKSYDEIGSLSVYQDFSADALRKQYSRAIKNLRLAFNR